MCIEIKDIRKEDYKKAVQFAIKGMHFDWYLNNSILLQLYGRYFWYYELNKATQILAAYVEDEFVGVLLAEMYDEKKKYNSWYQKLFVKVVDCIQKIFFKEGAGTYEEAAKNLQENYLEKNNPDGEVLFLAAAPNCKIKGVGTALLNALEEREKGKTVYLHTDDACTYQFYEHREFVREEETDIVLEMPKGKVPLKCFIYYKKLV